MSEPLKVEDVSIDEVNPFDVPEGMPPSVGGYVHPATRYVVVHQPPASMTLAQDARDRIMATGNVIGYVETRLNSLQPENLKRYASTPDRPVIALLVNVEDRYGVIGCASGYNSLGEHPITEAITCDLRDVTNFAEHNRPFRTAPNYTVWLRCAQPAAVDDAPDGAAKP